MSCINFISELSDFLELPQLETNYLDAQHDIAKQQNDSDLKTLDFQKMLFEYDIA
ncbi:MAG: hypothetical protein IJC06_00915 [Clostridia bacterium]|nr:hypothetical protein [Clostridia bacterium]